MLGNLDIQEEEEDDDDDDGGAGVCLRQTEEYASFIYLFLKSVAPSATIRSHTHVSLLSEYVCETLEGYAVLTYVNR